MKELEEGLKFEKNTEVRRYVNFGQNVIGS